MTREQVLRDWLEDVRERTPTTYADVDEVLATLPPEVAELEQQIEGHGQVADLLRIAYILGWMRASFLARVIEIGDEREEHGRQ